MEQLNHNERVIVSKKESKETLELFNEIKKNPKVDFAWWLILYFLESWWEDIKIDPKWLLDLYEKEYFTIEVPHWNEFETISNKIHFEKNSAQKAKLEWQRNDLLLKLAKTYKLMLTTKWWNRSYEKLYWTAEYITHLITQFESDKTTPKSKAFVEKELSELDFTIDKNKEVLETILSEVEKWTMNLSKEVLSLIEKKLETSLEDGKE